ncbi:MFS transporter [Dactylosporangium sp. AC04546]|uniref:MFS transporter n=1 Tax=Dactylosporangium sp. AC04546 TaxID=2862460 RepID=UPI001EDEE4F8|nr:MFS transporter [Dactylosporangium sp. AC04546]WVK79919.1 MFS transporter [Dactylosporangium sp. AC04546]
MLRNGFGWLLAAGLISLTGDWVMRVGLTYCVYELTGSTLASASALMASLVPQLVCGSLAGVYADRWDRRRTMVVTNLLLAAGLLPLLAVHDRDQVWIVYLVTAGQSALSQFFVAAEAAVIPQLVPAGQLVAANALNGQVRDVARLAGAALGGLAAALGGLPLLAVVDIVSFTLAAVLLLRLRTVSPATRRAHRPVLRDWADGARVAARSPALRVVLLFVVITGVGEAVMGSLMAPFVRDVLHADAARYGIIVAVQAGGGIAGGLVAAAVGHRWSPRRIAGYGALAFGALDLVLFLYPLVFDAWWPATVIILLAGFPAALALAGLLTVFQTHTADAFRGRVFGAANALQAGAMLVGATAAGLLGNRLGIVPVIAVQGAGYCLAGAIVLVLLRPGKESAGAATSTVDTRLTARPIS